MNIGILRFSISGGTVLPGVVVEQVVQTERLEDNLLSLTIPQTAQFSSWREGADSCQNILVPGYEFTRWHGSVLQTWNPR